MGSTLSSLPAALKTPLSYVTGGEEAAEWMESETAHVMHVRVAGLVRGSIVNVGVVECEGHVMKLGISGEVTKNGNGKKFTKFVKLPEKGGIYHRQAYVVVYDGVVVVTIPKVEEV